MTYEIGYRRPPTSSQFKKGSSGNPKGRPKGATNFITLLERELAQKIVVTENGKKKAITRMQAMVKRLVSGALQGDAKQLMAMVEILRRLERADSSPVEGLLPDNHAALLADYVASARTETDTTSPGHRTASGGVK